MLSNGDLIQRFVVGGTSGKCNRMAVAEFEGWTLLWGFGHALYAARRQDDGMLVVYEGWHGRSQTTSTHINALTGKAEDRYGDPINDGVNFEVAVDGEGGAEILEAPPKGHVLIIVDDVRPGCNYGTLDAHGRAELSEFDGRHVPSPNGTSSR